MDPDPQDKRPDDFWEHPDLEAALEAYARGTAPVIMSEIWGLPVRLHGRTTSAFGDLTSDELHVLAAEHGARAERSRDKAAEFLNQLAELRKREEERGERT